MYQNLTLSEKLKDERTRLGLTLEEVETATGISRSTIGKYENTDSSFTGITADVIVRLAKLYGVSTDYLLGLDKNKNHPATDLDDLQLDDAAVEVLKNGKFNHRLLGEVLCHPAFPRFMLDMEIYMDGMLAATMQNWNDAMEAVRQKIISTHNPEEDEYLRGLQAIQIPEDDYFAHKLAEDLAAITRDLRAAHKNDQPAVQSASVVSELKKDLNQYSSELEKAKARYEQLLSVICGKLQIRPSALNDEEKKALVNILKKSDLLKSESSQRGKGKKHR